jgi:hypothetical protein
MPITGTSGSNGIAFLVAGGLVYEIIAFACSSPQTAEINIKTRGDTLMKWVHAGQGLSAVTITAAAIIDRRHRVAIIAGGVFAMGSAELFYQHAKQSGLSRPGPTTEQHYGTTY